jgi:hypothetical protein
MIAESEVANQLEYATIHTQTRPRPPARLRGDLLIEQGYRNLVLAVIRGAILDLDSTVKRRREEAYYFLQTDCLFWFDLLGIDYDRQAWCERVNAGDFRGVAPVLLIESEDQ